MAGDFDLRKELTKELAQNFFALLMRHRVHFQGRLAELSLSVPQVHVLHALSEKPLTMREISQRTVFEPSHLTGVIDKLEGRHLVQRKVDPKDRRSKMVSLTRSGRAFLGKLLGKLHEPAPWMESLVWEDQAMLLLIMI